MELELEVELTLVELVLWEVELTELLVLEIEELVELIEVD